MRTIDDDVVVPCAPQGGAVSAATSPCSRGRASSGVLQCMACTDMRVSQASYQILPQRRSGRVCAPKTLNQGRGAIVGMYAVW